LASFGENTKSLKNLLYKIKFQKIMTKVYQSTVEYNEDFDEYYATIPEELRDSTGWEEGDVVDWHMNKDGTVMLMLSDEISEDNENE
jgi:hypothetical protein